MPVKTAPAKKTDAIKSKKGIKLRKLHIENFKAFDKLDLEFPEPRMKDDPDIVVMGSENGLGKTTVMEACALLFLVAYYENYTHYDALDIRQLQDLPIDLRETFIRAGASEAIINGSFAFHNDSERWGVQLFQHGRIRPDDPGRILQHLRFGIPRSTGPSLSPSRFFASLSALTSEPLLLPPLLYFHSYRKIQEGNPQFGMMFNTADRHYQKSLDPNLSETPVSALKIQLLHSMMSRAGLFEDLDPKEADDVFEKMNSLLEEYAHARIEKLRSSPNNQVELHVSQLDGGPSFAFDCLSSGQKEIISTLFLIWHYTREQPGIVLIDEPELHLNAEWHRRLLRKIHEIAPQNQYIVATHSEDIFGSVDENHRVLLERGG